MTDNETAGAGVAPPPVTLLQMMTGYWVSQAVYVAAKLGLADLLAAGPRGSDELAAATGAHAPSLYRLLRALASAGVFTETSPDRFALTPMAALLRTGTPSSRRALAIMYNEEQYRAWGELLHSVRTGQPAFEHQFGMGPFAYFAQHPEADRVFNEAMIGWTNQVGGDLFAAVPEGGDVYVLAQILHDWDDERCVAILERCRQAMPPHAKLLVVELVLPPGEDPFFGKWLDLHMLVMAGAGRRRPHAARTEHRGGRPDLIGACHGARREGGTGMTAHSTQRPVHLVGSVPLATAEEVFRMASAILGARVKRLPDGETGVRAGWIGWQWAVFARNPAFALVPNTDDVRGPDSPYRLPELFGLRPGVRASEIAFDDLGYANAALASYEVFARLKAEGAIPPATRFLVCLPTPLAPVTGFVARDSRAAVEPAYEARLLAELASVCAAIAHDQLAIQWDTAVEFAILEGFFPTHLADPQRDIIDRLVRLGERVPNDVELGYHLCYGDAGHQHFAQPRDAGRLVAVANAICAGVRRPVHWIHLPVPRDRIDEAYYAPLRDLALHPETELYLGLVHHTDGVEGTRERMAAAATAVGQFGIGTECGLGRRPAETIAPLLAVHRAAADGAR